MSFPDVFYTAQKLGLAYYRIYEFVTLYTTTYPFNAAVYEAAALPWGLFVGPDSMVDSFFYNDFTDGPKPSFGFSVGSPLVNIVPTQGRGAVRYISINRAFPNTVAVLIDIYVFFKPIVAQPPLKRNTTSILPGVAAYGAGNGVVTTSGLSNPAFGRKKLNLSFQVSSAAQLRLDLFQRVYDLAGAHPVDIPLYSFTTSGIAADGVQAEIPLSGTGCGINYIVTKIAGAAGTYVINGDVVD